MNLAQSYFGDSAEVLKQNIRENRATLEGLPDQIPGGREEAFQAFFQELMDNYSSMEECINEAQQNVANLATDQAGQVVGQAQAAAGGAAQQAKDTAGQATDQAGQAVRGVQDTVGGLTGGQQQQGGGPLGEVTDQVGQAAQGVQDTAQQATDQAGQVAGKAQDAAGGAGDEEPKVTNAARRKAQELGVDLSTVKGTGSGGLITLKDVTGS